MMSKESIFRDRRDISECKRAKEVERMGKAKYQDIFESALVGIFQSTPQGRFQSVNPLTPLGVNHGSLLPGKISK